MPSYGYGLIKIDIENVNTFLSDYVPLESSDGPSFYKFRLEEGDLVADYTFNRSISTNAIAVNGTVWVPGNEWIPWVMNQMPGYNNTKLCDSNYFDGVVCDGKVIIFKFGFSTEQALVTKDDIDRWFDEDRPTLQF